MLVWWQVPLSALLMAVMLSGCLLGMGAPVPLPGDDDVSNPDWNDDESVDHSPWEIAVIGSAMDGVWVSDIVDMDHDGDLDAVAHSVGTGELLWFANPGSRGVDWERHSIGVAFSSPESVRIADLDGDRDSDVIAFERRDQDMTEMTVFTNEDGEGGLWSKWIVDWDLDVIGSEPLDFAARDLDGDIDADLVFARDPQGLVWLENLEGNGHTWSAHDIDPAFDALLIAAEDIDGDEAVDVAACRAADGAVSWWRNKGVAEFADRELIGGQFRDVNEMLFVDMNGNQRLDAVVGTGSGDLFWYENPANSNAPWVERFMGSAIPTDAGDVDHDGDADILGIDTAGRPLWLENRASGSALPSPAHLIADPNLAVDGVRGADVDGDGWMDAVVVGQEHDTIAWLRHPGF